MAAKMKTSGRSRGEDRMERRRTVHLAFMMGFEFNSVFSLGVCLQKCFSWHFSSKKLYFIGINYHRGVYIKGE